MALVDQHYQASIERSKLVGQYGLDLLRALFLLNGGAILVLATFLGSDASGPGATELFTPVIQIFSAGVFAAIAATVFGYLCQQQYAIAERAAAREADAESKRHASWGNSLQIAAMVVALASLAAFWFALDRGLHIEVPPRAQPAPTPVVVSVQQPQVAQPARRVVVGCSDGDRQIALHLGGVRRNICRPAAPR